MTLLEFLSHNLRFGDKVELTIKYYDRSQKTITAFFHGFRILDGRHISIGNNLYPMFKKMNKNGKMSREYTDEYTSLETIKSITKLTEDATHFMPEELPSIQKCTYIKNHLAKKQITAICKELATLFPDKWIPLPSSGELDCALWDEHGGIALATGMNILRIRYGKEGEKEGYLVCAAPDYAEPNIYPSWRHDLEYSPLALLRVLVQDIALEGELPETAGEEGDCINFSALPWRTFPLAGPGCPVLKNMGLLELLRYNLWWKSLSPQEKEAVFAFEKSSEDANAFLSEFPDCTFADYCDNLWLESNSSSKRYFFGARSGFNPSKL